MSRLSITAVEDVPKIYPPDLDTVFFNFTEPMVFDIPDTVITFYTLSELILASKLPKQLRDLVAPNAKYMYPKLPETIEYLAIPVMEKIPTLHDGIEEVYGDVISYKGLIPKTVRVMKQI